LRITVVGINYAPEVTGIAPYTTGIAEGLTRLGHSVTVITGLPHYPEWRVNEAFVGERSYTERINGVDVRRLRHHVPERPSARGRILMEASFARAVSMHGLNKPDAVIAVSPTLLSTVAVVARARMARIPVGVIVQDIYSKGVVETGAMSGRSANATKRLEVGALRVASSVAAIHHRFAEVLQDMGLHEDKINVIRNWTHIGESPKSADPAETRRRLGWKPDELVVLHTGNMGVKQGLENVVAAGRLADSSNAHDKRVRFVMVGDGNQRELLDELSTGVESVNLLNPLPADEFRLALDAADVLLVNERPGVGEMAVPSKLTSYFVAGKPVLAATDPHSGSAEELRASGAGIIVPPGQPSALLDAARQLGADDQLRRRLGARGKSYADDVLSAGSAIASYDRWCREMAGQTAGTLASTHELPVANNMRSVQRRSA
jgi:glycosyltransferase involved in cell wall biosynthesis